MSLIDFDRLDPIAHPELLFGVVAAVGTPVDFVCKTLESLLSRRGYDVTTISLSKQMAGLSLSAQSLRMALQGSKRSWQK